MLKNREKMKLKLLKVVGEAVTPVPRDRLLTDMGISFSTLRRDILSLNEDFLEDPELQHLSIRDNGCAYTFENPSDLNPYYVIQKLNLFYYTNATQFQVLRSIFATPNQYISELANNLSISLPYVYRILAELNQILEKFHLKINYYKSEGNLSLTGNAINIRLFEFYFFWGIHQGIDWPFHSTTAQELINSFPEDELEKLFGYSQSKRYKLLYLMAITQYNFFLTPHSAPINKDFSTILRTFKEVNDFSRPLSNYIQKKATEELDPQKLEQELLYFNYICRFTTNMDDENNQIEIGKKLATLNLPIIDYVFQLIEALSAEFPFFSQQLNEEDTRHKTIYYLVLYFSNVFFLDFDTSGLSELLLAKQNISINDTASFKQSKKFFDTFIQETPYRPDVHFSEFHLKIGYSVIHQCISSLVVRPITIYLQFSKNIFIETYVINKIHRIFGKDMIQLSTDISNVDIVISDYFENAYTCPNYFYLDDLDDPDCWDRLTKFIYNYQLAKIY